MPTWAPSQIRTRSTVGWSVWMPDRPSNRAPSFRGCRTSSPRASEAMRRNHSRDTKAELLLRRTLWQAGMRFRIHGDLPGRPDVVITGHRVAVFCDGDFWHGRDWARRRAMLLRGSNSKYWVAKILANRKRDRINTHALSRLGWTVVRLWETDITAYPDAAAQVVLEAVEARAARRSDER